MPNKMPTRETDKERDEGRKRARAPLLDWPRRARARTEGEVVNAEASDYRCTRAITNSWHHVPLISPRLDSIFVQALTRQQRSYRTFVTRSLHVRTKPSKLNSPNYKVTPRESGGGVTLDFDFSFLIYLARGPINEIWTWISSQQVIERQTAVHILHWHYYYYSVCFAVMSWEWWCHGTIDVYVEVKVGHIF